jgi:Cu2+-exporting ATPase
VSKAAAKTMITVPVNDLDCCSQTGDDKPKTPSDDCCKPMNCRTAATAETKSTDSCCGAADRNLSDYSCADGCCDDSDGESSKDSCMDDCCKSLPTRREEKAPSSCSKHIQDAFDRYEKLILMGKCLCRKVLDQLGVCCCSLSPNGLAPTSVCDSHLVVSRKPGVKVITAPKPDGDKVMQVPQCMPIDKKPAVSTKPAKVRDVERDAAREHVVLKVSGMTCTGCTRKMMNVLDRISGVSNAKVAFVSELAEFELDNNVCGADEVLSQVERETGFKISRIVSGYQHLDLLMSSIIASTYLETCAAGVVSLTQQQNKSYRVTYNPRIVGARSLLLSDTTLAPPAPDFSVSEGNRRFRNMLVNFLVSLTLTIPVLVLSWSDNSVPGKTRQLVSLVLATLVQAIAIPEFYIGAFKSMIYSRVIEMDMLVVISVTAA